MVIKTVGICRSTAIFETTISEFMDTNQMH
jgi:hypothetical protein